MWTEFFAFLALTVGAAIAYTIQNHFRGRGARRGDTGGQRRPLRPPPIEPLTPEKAVPAFMSDEYIVDLLTDLNRHVRKRDVLKISDGEYQNDNEVDR
jgi:hypothetical protein